VQVLPSVVSLAAAVVIAPALLRRLEEGGHLRENYRGALLPCPLGVLVGASAFVALAPLALWAAYVDADDVPVAAAST